jgi:hypothetical protein
MMLGTAANVSLLACESRIAAQGAGLHSRSDKQPVNRIE